MVRPEIREFCDQRVIGLDPRDAGLYQKAAGVAGRAGYRTVEAVRAASDTELLRARCMGPALLGYLRELVGQ